MATTSISKKGSLPAGCVGVPLLLFGLIFGAVGVGVAALTTVVPLWHLQQAQSWKPARCEVTFSQVANSGRGDTSRIDVRYRYEWGDKRYSGQRYDFTTGSDNFGNSAKAEIITHYRPGTTVDCFVNPQDPTQSVINRDVKWRYFFGFAFGLPFASVPLLMIGFGLYARRSQRRQADSGIARWGVGLGPVGGATTGGTTTQFGSPSGFGPASGLGDAGPVELKPSASPLGKLIGMAALCLFWNGITGVFTYFELTKKFADAPWFFYLFLIPFQLIGLALVWGVIKQFLALANPVPHLTLSSRSVALGSSFTLQWRFTGAVSRLAGLRITLQGIEEVRYRRGTDTYTDRHTFYDVPIIETSDGGRVEAGVATVNIPAETMHTFVASDNKILWKLCVKGEIPRWPDIDTEFPIMVRPR